MPTRKQRRRIEKGRRHEYETVWVDDEGNEIEGPPDDYVEPAPREKRSDGKPSAKSQRPQQGSARATKTPLPPSWRRSAKRSLILGGVIFVLFALLVRSKSGQHDYASALFLSVLYTALFIPFTFYVDRFTYRRWQRKTGERSTKR